MKYKYFLLSATPCCAFSRPALAGAKELSLTAPRRRLGNAPDSLASWRDSAYIRAILIGFAGRTKEKEWAENPLFSFVKRPAGPNVEKQARVTELMRRIEDIVAPTIVGMGYELVRVSMSKGGGTLQIMIEPADGRAMDVEGCATVARALSAVLDVEDPIPSSYTLEVSSPGMDRPLRNAAEYERFRGRMAKISTAEPVENEKYFEGRLAGFVDGKVRLELKGKVARTVELPLEMIRKANLMVEF